MLTGKTSAYWDSGLYGGRMLTGKTSAYWEDTCLCGGRMLTGKTSAYWEDSGLYGGRMLTGKTPVSTEDGCLLGRLLLTGKTAVSTEDECFLWWRLLHGNSMEDCYFNGRRFKSNSWRRQRHVISMEDVSSPTLEEGNDMISCPSFSNKSAYTINVVSILISTRTQKRKRLRPSGRRLSLDNSKTWWIMSEMTATAHGIYCIFSCPTCLDKLTYTVTFTYLNLHMYINHAEI